MIWEKLQGKELVCSGLNDVDFELLGEYFMGQMTGTSHEAMDRMMAAMYGEQGLENMHIAMGKRFSGCDLNAQFPFNMPMMGMMWGNWSNPQNFGFNNMTYNNMMGYGWGYGMPFGWLGWIFMILWWVIVIAVIVWVIRAIFGRGRRHWNCCNDGNGEKGPLEILKERYAKGEIDKSEYEDKKKDLEK